MAAGWFDRLVERRDVWGYWRANLPIGPMGTPEQYKSADQSVQRMGVFSVRAFTARGAVESAFERFRAGAPSIKSYLRPS